MSDETFTKAEVEEAVRQAFYLGRASARPRFWRWLMHIIWATPEENARYVAIDDELSFPHLHGGGHKPRFPGDGDD